MAMVTTDNTKNGLKFKMTKTGKIIIRLLFVEAVFTAYYFYAQPLCEPCLPELPCPPCISKEQIFIIWIGVIIAVATIIYLLISSLKKT